MEQLTPKNQKGFSTIELLIATTIMVLVLGAVIPISFGNQAFLASSQEDKDALAHAEAVLRKAEADARKDFRMVNSEDETSDGYYSTDTHVGPAGNPLDHMSKLIRITTKWKDYNALSRSITLSAIVTNFEHARGGDTCNSYLTGDWSNPEISNTSLASLVGGDSAASYSISGIDAYESKLFVATEKNIYVIDSNDPNNLVLKDTITNDGKVLPASARFTAITTDGEYVYVATSSAAAQFAIIDVRASPYKIIKPLDLAGGTGNSIFYDNGYVYLGLVKSGNTPEFYIIDVHDPLSSTVVGSYTVGNDVNSVYRRNNYVYIAHPTDTLGEQLTILDMSDASHPNKVSGYKASGLTSGGNGRYVYTVGDTIYLGRTTTNDKELYILNNVDPAKLAENNTLPLGTFEMNSSIGGLIVRDYLAFVLTGEKKADAQLKILNVKNPAQINEVANVALTGTASSVQQENIDCEGNYIFIAGDTGIITTISAR